MTDNRTSEPNKYAGFIARQEHQSDPWRGIGKKCLCGVVFDSDVDHAMHQVEAILEAALVAAQGAAPSGDIRVLAEAEVRKSAAEGNPISEPGVTKDIAFVRGAVFAAAQGAAPQAESDCWHEASCSCAAALGLAAGQEGWTE